MQAPFRIAIDTGLGLGLVAAVLGVASLDRPKRLDDAELASSTKLPADADRRLFSGAAVEAKKPEQADVAKLADEIPHDAEVIATPKQPAVGAAAPAEAVLGKVDVGQNAAQEPINVAPPTGSIMGSGKIYALRTEEKREEWIQKFGGSTISEKSVRDGLNWLARHQAVDGSWSSRCLGSGPESRCEHPDDCSGCGRDYAMAQTGLALLAFMAGGHYDFNSTEYSQTVRRGLDWLVANQDADGTGDFRQPTAENVVDILAALRNGDGQLTGMPGSPAHFMYQRGIAAFALAEACAVAKASQHAPEPRYLEAATQAIRYIEDQQHNDGGWRYTTDSNEQSDTSVSGWQLLALKTAKEAGIEIDSEVVSRAKRFFKSCETGHAGRTAYTADGMVMTEATTGVGMLVHQFLLDTPDSRLARQAAAYLADAAEEQWGDGSRRPARNARRRRPELQLQFGARGGSRRSDYYLWYNCTLAMFQAGGPAWERWNKVVRDNVIGLQEQSGCVRGSWVPDDQWGGSGGRVYSTALAVLTLEVYYRYAADPDAGGNASRNVDDDAATPDAASAGSPRDEQEADIGDDLDDESVEAPRRAEPENMFRVWTSEGDGHTTEAKMASYANGVVTLENRDGKRIKVPLHKLSKADQDFVANWRNQRR